MKIDEMGYVDDMRGRLGLEDGDNSKDSLLESMDAFNRVKLIVGWNLGDGEWAETFKYWCESQGLFINRFDPTKLEYIEGLVNAIQYTDKVTPKKFFELVGAVKEALK